MFKKNETLFALLQRLFDALTVFLCWWGAYLIRFKLMKDGQQGLEVLFLKLSPIIIGITIYFFSKNGLYLSQRFSSRYREIGAVIKANSISNLIFVILLYFFAEERLSRIVLLYYFFISNFSLIVLRISVRNFLRILRRGGKNLRHILLIGNGDQIGQYITAVRNFKDAGINFVGWINSEGKASRYNIQEISSSMKEAKDQFQPDSIVIGYQGSDYYMADRLIQESYNDLTPIQVLPDLTLSFIGHEIEDFAGIPLLTVNKAKMTFLDSFIKRGFDLIVSLIGLIIISPLLLIIATIIKLTSRGPIFYGQERMGLDGKSFKMWKFRSMNENAEETTGAVWASKNDNRRTSVGTFLRSTSLDELPQLWNVVIGNMSLVGPIPERPIFVEKFRDDIPAYMLRHTVKTGITGWAQVNGWRGDTCLSKRIECDIFYIKNWTLWFDIKILILTFWKGFINKNAY